MVLKLLVGLGNPGAEYEDTRHNAGFAWIDAVARELKVSLRAESSYFGLVARANLASGPLWLLEPMTYMNLSGKVGRRAWRASSRSSPRRSSSPTTSSTSRPAR